MPRYQWQASEAVTQAEVRENRTHRYAELHLNAGLSAEQLRGISDKLQRHGMIATPFAKKGEALLRVRNFTDDGELFTHLQGEGLVMGAPMQSEALPEDGAQKKGLINWFRELPAIRKAGLLYLPADAMPVLSGLTFISKGKYKEGMPELVAGLVFGSTSAMLAAFGQKSPEFQMGNMYAGLKEHLYQEGVELGTDDKLAIEQSRTKPDYWNKLLNFFYEHPVLANNIPQGYACFKNGVGGFQQKDMWKGFAGLSGSAGQFGSLAIPEDKHAGRAPEERVQKIKDHLSGTPDEDGPQTSFLSSPTTWVKERPLRLMAGTMLQNVLVGWSGWVFNRTRVHDFYGAEKGGALSYLNPLENFKSNAHLESLQGGKYGELLDLETQIHNMKNGAFSEYEALDTRRLKLRAEHDEMRLFNRARLFSAASPFFNFAANYTYSLAPKDERSIDLDAEGYLDEPIARAAHIFAALPEGERDVRISKFAGFLAHQPDILINRSQIVERVMAQIEELEQSPWAREIEQERSKKPAKLRDEDAVAVLKQPTRPLLREQGSNAASDSIPHPEQLVAAAHQGMLAEHTPQLQH